MFLTTPPAVIQREKLLPRILYRTYEPAPYSAESYRNLAFEHFAKDEYDQSLRLFHKALAIRETTLGPNHADAAQSYHGAAHYANGEYDQSLIFLHKALAIRETTLGKEHRDTKITLEWILMVKSRIN
jgi:tetratricopeptide (TPR) repeat protein